MSNSVAEFKLRTGIMPTARCTAVCKYPVILVINCIAATFYHNDIWLALYYNGLLA